MESPQYKQKGEFHLLAERLWVSLGVMLSCIGRNGIVKHLNPEFTGLLPPISLNK